MNSIIQSFKNTVYRGPVRTAVRSLGLESALLRPYLAFLRLTGADVTTYRVSGAAASFYRSVALPESVPEPNVAESICGSLRPDDVLYDVGANEGIYTCLGGEIVTDGRVVAVEPDPDNVERLRRNVELNDLDNVTVERAAVSDYVGEGTIVSDSTRTSLSGFRGGTAGEETTGVDVVTLEHLVDDRGLPCPDVLKVDVEGAELAALSAAESVLQDRTCRHVYCEVHERLIRNRGGDPAELTRLLEAAGFSTSELFRRDEHHYMIHASRED